MNKEQVITIVQDSLDKGVVTKADLASLNPRTNAGAALSAAQDGLVSKVLYSLGGLIALIGVVFFLSENWDVIGSAGRLLVTVGFFLATFVGGFVLFRKAAQPALTQVFFALSAAIAPLSAFVLLKEMGVREISSGSHILIGIALTAIFGAALYATRLPIFYFVIGGFFSWAYYASVAQLVKGSGFSLSLIRDITVYTSMILGIAYLAYSSWVHKISVATSSAAMRRIGSFYVFAAFSLTLISALFLGAAWDFFYAFLAVGAVALSIQMRTTIGLVVSAGAIGIYVIKISSKYFADSIGWPLALILIGFAIIGLGYFTYYLNKKYISGTK